MFAIFNLPGVHGRINPELVVRADHLVQRRPPSPQRLRRIEQELNEQRSMSIINRQWVAPGELGVPGCVLTYGRFEPVLKRLLALLRCFYGSCKNAWAQPGDGANRFGGISGNSLLHAVLRSYDIKHAATGETLAPPILVTNQKLSMAYTKRTGYVLNQRTIDMARRGISPADVARAYVQLKQQGREPSLRNLRLQMGRGGYSTIAAHLKKLSFVPGGELKARRHRERRAAHLGEASMRAI